MKEIFNKTRIIGVDTLEWWKIRLANSNLMLTQLQNEHPTPSIDGGFSSQININIALKYKLLSASLRAEGLIEKADIANQTANNWLEMANIH